MKLIRLAFVVVLNMTALLSPVHAQATGPEWVTVTPERVQETCDSPCKRDALIFVHGIFGSKDTWLNTDTNAYWPALFAADTELRDIDIYRADYENYLLKAGPSMKDVLESFARGMQPIHAKNYRSIQFITHSLGGLIVRRYLLHVKLRYGHKILSKYRQVVMLGTPNDGSYFASLGEIASRNQLLRVLKPVNENDFLAMLNTSIDDLSKKHHQTFCPSLHFFVGYETKALFLDKIVSPKSAASSVDCSFDGRPVDSCIHAFPRTHLSLVKPADAKDEVYLWTKGLIRDCADGKLCKPEPILPDCGNLEPYTRGSALQW